jgi:hypothetical protein
MAGQLERGWFVVVCCLAWSLISVAQPPHAAAQATEEYESVLAEALAEFDAGRWVEALALFSRANDIYPNARVLRGVGMASFELGDYATAVRALQQSLDSSERPLTDAQRTSVQELLQRSLRFVARLRLSVTPAPESVLVDGRPAVMSDGTVLLNPGTREIVVTASAHQTVTRNVEVIGGTEVPLVIALQPDESVEVAPPPLDLTAPEADEAPSSSMGAAGWASLSAGAGAGVAALLTGVFAQRLHNDLESECGGPCLEDRQSDIDRGTRLARTSTALTFVSVAAIGVGVTLLVLGRDGGDATTTEVSADVGLGRAGATVRVTF